MSETLLNIKRDLKTQSLIRIALNLNQFLSKKIKKVSNKNIIQNQEIEDKKKKY